MNPKARLTIEQLRKHGFRVLFQCNADSSISVAAVAPNREAFIVHGKLCDDSRIIAELARMTGIDQQAGAMKP